MLSVSTYEVIVIFIVTIVVGRKKEAIEIIKIYHFICNQLSSLKRIVGTMIDDMIFNFEANQQKDTKKHEATKITENNESEPI